jgi:hypothetical protein
MEQRRRLQKQLSTFSVERSRCFLEAHRDALVADIAAQFGSVDAFETFIQSELPQRIRVLRHAPVPLLTTMVGAISHLFLMTSIISSFLRSGDTLTAAHGVLVLPLVWICTDSLALNLVLLLAGRRHTEEAGTRASGCRDFVGTLASATIFAGLNAFSMGVILPVLPIWAAVLILLAMLSAVAVLYLRDYASVEEPAGATPQDEERGGEEPRLAPPSVVPNSLQQNEAPSLEL